jgi:hypothetical protein
MNAFSIRFGVGLLAIAVIARIGGIRAAQAEWRVGLAQAKITPEQPIVMAGYAARTKPFEKVGSDLYVKALVLDDGAGHRGAIVTSDLIGFTAAVAEPICERLQKSIGLAREQILINSSHTHTGPSLSLNESGPDDANAGDVLRTLDYTRQLQDKVVAVVEQAAARVEPANLSWGSGVVNFVMNRREFTPQGVILGDNPRGLADRSVPILLINSPDGTPRAVLFGAAVHNTTLRSDYFQISGDYAGFAQELVQQKYPGVQAMFMLGCAGDADPYPRGTIELARQHGAALGEEVCRALDNGKKLRPLNGTLTVTFAKIELPLQPAPTREELQRIASERRNPKAFGAGQMLARLDQGKPLETHYSCPLAVWQLGDLTLVGLSGEVVVDYVPLLEKALGPNQLWISAYCNDVFGYLPSARVLSEGGYETRGLYTGGAGFFTSAAQDVLVTAVRNLARQAGRSLPD